jgi:beta-glucosidase
VTDPVTDRVAERVPTLIVDGRRFRDLDGDGVLAPYEDWRRPTDERVADLVSRMSRIELAGTLVHGTAPATGGPLGGIGVGAGYDLDTADELIRATGVTSLITRLALPPRSFAEQNNALQDLAARGRLGIPVMISSDPRHHFGDVVGASHNATGFSQWPEPLGLAAVGDRDLVVRFGDIVRREYRAVGITMSLAPQADPATSPRWPRTNGTFGESPALCRSLAGAYVEGIQGGRHGLARGAVAAVVKHWVGYGAARDGFDGHNWYGRHSAFPSGALADHIEAFLDALECRVAGVMPTYNILEGVVFDGEPLEQVGAGFSRQLVTDLLRNQLGHRGLVLSDWAITRDLTEAARTGSPPQTPDLIAMPWGVENLSRVERFAKALGAGVDQIGGENDPNPILDALDAGLLSESRLRDAATAVLRLHFDLGLFDDPFVEPGIADTTVGDQASTEAAQGAQRLALTVLHADRSPIVGADDVVHVDGIEADAFDAIGIRTTTRLDDATVALVRIGAPYEVLHSNHFFGARQHEGRLDYSADHPDLVRVHRSADAVRTVVIVDLDRPAVLAGIGSRASTLIGCFGASDQAIADVVCGRTLSRGRLPFRLSASMEDVLAQPCDRPDDGIPVLYPFGHRAD